jgi:post-segregation antitoxin (ccd killing protein)
MLLLAFMRYFTTVVFFISHNCINFHFLNLHVYQMLHSICSNLQTGTFTNIPASKFIKANVSGISMPTIACSVGLTPELWEKSRRYKINRSAVARKAIAEEVMRIEKETGATLAKESAPASHPMKEDRYDLRTER